jgi:hypothetical protein
MMMANRPPALDLGPAGGADDGADLGMQMDENTLCPGCKRSVVDETGGVVVAFGCVPARSAHQAGLTDRIPPPTASRSSTSTASSAPSAGTR